ncbi:ATP-dependent DNA helicase UvrD2 [Candidatus Woesearchaeota archaeon]|nr:ATP-dependent DNA helicase UvrD2 [Candidatus Woesearchaeota archaeon]
MANQDYLQILQAIKDIPFPVGRKFLIEYLQGKSTHDAIKRQRLDRAESFGALAYDRDEISPLIDLLLMNSMIEQRPLTQNRFIKVLHITAKGESELREPSLHKRKIFYEEKQTSITGQEQELFIALDPFLHKYNDLQKKAIISPANKLLCIAGAGSGKTTVLTKRIEYLVTYQSIDPKKILAITFTRKARQEMQKRLPMTDCHIETFNSFCEKLLKRHNDLIYDKPMQVIAYRDKYRILYRALETLGMSMDRVLALYFSDVQRRGKTPEQLQGIFVNDLFFLRDYFKFKRMPLTTDAFHIERGHEQSFNMVLSICNYIEAYMKKKGLRDFADQLLDTIDLFTKHSDTIPKFEHILVDEYQDVNNTQIELLELLAPPNLFCVGDPRQSIFGWRGSNIAHILNFEDKYPDAEVVALTTNYRSEQHIVELMNTSIRTLSLPDLASSFKEEHNIHIKVAASEADEFAYILRQIEDTDLPRNEIFILARTNRKLTDLRDFLNRQKIPHAIKSEELHTTMHISKEQIILATIHAIKGLEAEMVFVIGCTPSNFPCKSSDHPIIDMVKVEEYDKFEEERRLFYVAISRAKRCLHITYVKSHTLFLTDEMRALIAPNKVQKTTSKAAKSISKAILMSDEPPDQSILSKLKAWRAAQSKRRHIPPYMVMQDKTLEHLCKVLPKKKEALQGIYGLGAAKIEKYGDELINLIN